MTQTLKARVYRGTDRNLRFLARRLRGGEIVAVPTETVYGLAGNALDERACGKIFRAKGRPEDDPLIVHIHALRQLSAVCEPNPAALRLAKVFWPGPLTVVLPKKPTIPHIVTAGRDSVAVRMPQHAVFRRLLKLTDLPLAAPSANRFGYISPTSVEHVIQGLGTKIRYVLQGGSASVGIESTIVDLRRPERPVILRPGFITNEQLADALGVRVLNGGLNKCDPRHSGQIAPGLLERHYSPVTRVVLHAKLVVDHASSSREAYVFIRKPEGPHTSHTFWLDERGNLEGVARQLFSTLRKLDTMGFETLHVELAPGKGLALAINDRLRRAAAR